MALMPIWWNLLLLTIALGLFVFVLHCFPAGRLLWEVLHISVIEAIVGLVVRIPGKLLHVLVVMGETSRG
jgi:hypothetical protein